jgi:hypothetical protein
MRGQRANPWNLESPWNQHLENPDAPDLKVGPT